MAVDFISVLAGPLIGIAGGWLERSQKIKQTKVDNEFKLKTFEHEIELGKQNRIAAQEANEQAMSMNRAVTDSDLAKFEMKGEYDGLLASIEADSKLNTGPIMTNLRGSVRPVLTYMGVIVTTFMTFAAHTSDLKAAAALTVYTNTSMMLAWWFGGRPPKTKGGYLKD